MLRTDILNCECQHFWIYHNVFLRAPLKRPQGVSDGKPVKQATTTPKTRQKRAGSVFTVCIRMRASA